MLSMKRLALRRSGIKKRNAVSPVLRTIREWVSRFGSVLASLALLAGLGPPVQGQRLPLPPEEQQRVNKAIDRGIDYLKKNQHKNGTWESPDVGHPVNHSVGYAALSALTLLECGVRPDDPVIQSTARYVRSKQTKLDGTYDLSLAILFLDRIGDPKDKRLIQKFALRLVAGQTATGGWGYKCPRLSLAVEGELMTTLRHLNPPPDIVRKPPADLPGLAVAENKPNDLDKVGQKPVGKPGKGIAPALSGSVAREAGQAPPPPQGMKADRKDAKPGEAQPVDGKPGEGNAKERQAAPTAKPKKPYVIPERLRALAVVQDPASHELTDPPDRSGEAFLSTTDNSNTQFAILALWTAQRHDVPLDRTLQLIVRRFVTSQNADGSWGYSYTFGGGESGGPSMIGVGLIGLAVGHGLTDPEQKQPAGKPVRDPRILNGLAALSQHVGEPAGKMTDLPLQNLYYLWTLERVAVLYNLPLIGDKDWYRWGAEILVANQLPDGNWDKGQYPGSSTIPDTCFALLFLRRANLTRDLAAKLPFNPAELNKDLIRKLTPPPTPAKPPEPAQPEPTPEEPQAEPKEEFIAKPLERPPEPEVAPTAQGGKMKWVALAFVVFLLLAGGSLYLVLAAIERSKDKGSHRPSKSKGPKSKTKPRVIVSRRAKSV